jgi:hypothetical protein
MPGPILFEIDPVSEVATNFPLPLIGAVNSVDWRLREMDVPTPEEATSDAGSPDADGDPIGNVRYRNRTITLTILGVAPSDNLLQTGVQIIQQKLEKIRDERGTLKFTTQAGSEVVADVYFAELKGQFAKETYGLKKALEFTLVFTCGPYLRGLPVDQTSDDYSTNTIADYTFDAGAGTLSVSGGQLVPSSTAEKRIIHTATPYDMYDGWATIKVVTGASVASGTVGAMVKRLDALNYLVAQIEFAVGASATTVRLGRVDAGSLTSMASTLTTTAASTAYWIRFRIEGNTVTAEFFTTAPGSAPPTTSTSTTLSGANATKFGVGVAGRTGIRFIPQATDWRLDDFLVLPHATVERTLPAVTLLARNIRGDVPALGKLVIEDQQNQDQWWAIWGQQSRYYDTSVHSALYYEAEGRTPLGGSATATGPTGASGSAPNVVRNTNLANVYQAILSTHSGGTAIAKVKDVGSFNGGAPTNSSPDPFTITVGAGGAAIGNKVIVLGITNNGANPITGITDSRGNTYTIHRSGTGIRIFVASATITTALLAADVITIDRAGAGHAYAIASEWSGLGAYDTGNDATWSGTAADGGSITLGAAGELLLGLFQGASGNTLPTLANPSFTTDALNWTATFGSITRNTGRFQSTPASGDWLSFSAPEELSTAFTGTFKAGVTYTLTFYCICSTSYPGLVAEFGLVGTDSASIASGGGAFNPTTSFTQFTIIWTPGADRTGVTFRIYRTGAPGSLTLGVDTFVLAASDAGQHMEIVSTLPGWVDQAGVFTNSGALQGDAIDWEYKISAAAGIASASATTQQLVGTGLGCTAAFASAVPLAGIALAHIGTYRVFARFQVPTTNTGRVDVCLEWAQGDYHAVTRNPEVQFVAGSGASSVWGGRWRIVDLGEVHLTEVPKGVQQWEGRILARSTVVGDDIDIDWLMLVPTDEGSGEAETTPKLQTPSTFIGRDEFDQANGDLNGKTAPIGGNWAMANLAWDVIDSDSMITGATGENIARLGASSNSDIRVEADVWLNSGSSVLRVVGVAARYVDANNFVYAGISDTQGGTLAIAQKVGGSFTGGRNYFFPVLLDRFYRLTLQIDAYGRAAVWLRILGDPPGAPKIVFYSADLATGGALATGLHGMYDLGGTSAGFRLWDQFNAAALDRDATIYASQSVEIRGDRALREDSVGVVVNRSAYQGDWMRVMPAGKENRSTRIIAKCSRNQHQEMPDPSVIADDLAVRLAYTPRYLELPG